jgi:hypothetical protein
MNPRLIAVAVIAVASVGLVPSGASATSGVAAKAPKPPKPPVSGRWKLASFNPAISRLTGSMVVAAKHTNVHGTKVTLGSGTPKACGKGTIKVLGKHQIVLGEGRNESGTYQVWVVGTVDTARGDFDNVKGDNVTLSRAGKHFSGTLGIALSAPRGGPADDGQIAFKGKGGRQCAIQFDAVK